jgi:ElaB/YqjD/DUF883 family membrane-anchored ribosome-binding protein
MQPQSPSQDTKSALNGASKAASSAVNSATSSVNSATNTAMGAIAPIASQLADSFGDVQGRAVEAYDFSMDYFKRHPGRCLATGALIGLAAGFLLRRRR